MNKVWIFVEGDSEEEFVKYLLSRIYEERIYICNDLIDFSESDISGSDFFAVYIENCNSIDKIPHRINELDYLIKRTGTNKILVIGDVERLGCYSCRRNRICDILNENVPQENLKTVFFKPSIETEYWDCKELIIRIIQLDYREKFSTNTNPEIVIPADINHGIHGLKDIFKQYRLKYRESRFAKKFFPRVNFECQNETLIRAKEIIEEFVS